MSLKKIKIRGPAGRLEGKYYISGKVNNIALIFHPHPLFGGTMDNKVVFSLYKSFVNNGFNVLRINFRGVGYSDGRFDNGFGELKDAIAAFDWLQNNNSNASIFWVAGFSFGSYIAMQLLMRRPEISNFIAIAPPVDNYDFSFLNPCPVPGQIIQGDCDEMVDYRSVIDFSYNVNRNRMHQNTSFVIIKNANHFFTDHIRELFLCSYRYIQKNINLQETNRSVKLETNKTA